MNFLKKRYSTKTDKIFLKDIKAEEDKCEFEKEFKERFENDTGQDWNKAKWEDIVKFMLLNRDNVFTD